MHRHFKLFNIYNSIVFVGSKSSKSSRFWRMGVSNSTIFMVSVSFSIIYSNFVSFLFSPDFTSIYGLFSSKTCKFVALSRFYGGCTGPYYSVAKVASFRFRHCGICYIGSKSSKSSWFYGGGAEALKNIFFMLAFALSVD